MGKWEMVRLGDVCTGTVTNIAQKNLDNNNGDYPIYGASGFIKCVDFYKQDKPYIAVVKDGAGVGRVSRMPTKSSVIGTLQNIIPNENIDVNYLYYAMLKMNLGKFYTGATIPHIYFKDYKKEELPLPPLPVQQKIADVLDRANALIEKRKTQIEKLDLLVKSQFVEMFGDPVTNPKKITTTLFENIVTLQRGFDLPIQSRNTNGKIPVYGSNGILDYHDIAKVKGGGIITGRSGTIGKVHYTKNDYWPLNTTLFSVNLHGNNIIFLAYLLKFFDLSRFVEGSGVPTLNRNIVHKEKIINVPIELQNKFAYFVERIEVQKSQMKCGLELMELGYKSLMQKCFNGEMFT